VRAKLNDEKAVFREELKEHRGAYYVTYQPADSRWHFATVSLVFHGNKAPVEQIRQFMENELRQWVTRFPIPAMVSSFDATESLIHLPRDQGGSHLFGYYDPIAGRLVENWKHLENEEMLASEISDEQLDRVYKGVPFRFARDVRSAAEEEHRKLRMGFRLVRVGLLFFAAIPVAIELISLGVSWLGYILQGLSIAVGIHKILKSGGRLPKSKAAEQKEEKQRKMEHYYYHCELNPVGFDRLKVENFNREAAERTRKEAQAISARLADPKPPPASANLI
jgi:hypothetical protein